MHTSHLAGSKAPPTPSSLQMKFPTICQSFPLSFSHLSPAAPFSSVSALVQAQCLSRPSYPSSLGWAVRLPLLASAAHLSLTFPVLHCLCTGLRFLPLLIYCCGSSSHLSITTGFVHPPVEPQARLSPAGLSMHESSKHMATVLPR